MSSVPEGWRAVSVAETKRSWMGPSGPRNRKAPLWTLKNKTDPLMREGSFLLEAV